MSVSRLQTAAKFTAVQPNAGISSARAAGSLQAQPCECQHTPQVKMWGRLVLLSVREKF